jgi:hypothetical protein
MANVNNPRGLTPARYKGANAWNGAANLYYIPSSDGSAYYPGDIVKSAAGGDPNGIPQIQKAIGTDTIRGVIVANVLAPPYAQSLQGIILDNTIQYVPASKSKAYYVWVVDDPDVVFEVVDDGLNILTATSCNKNCSLTITAPTSPQQMSGTVLNTASVATTQALNFKIMGLVQRDDNAFGQYAHWLVTANQHELMGNTAGV